MKNEIDLIEFCVKLFLLLKRNIVLIVIFTVIGVVVGFARYLFTKPYYETSLVLSSNILNVLDISTMQQTLNIPNIILDVSKIQNQSDKIIVEIINSLRTYIKEENYDLLSKELNIDGWMAASIADIEASLVKDEDKKEIQNYFKIKLKVYDNTLFDTIRNGIIYYVNNNDFIREKFEQRKKIIETIISKIDEEIIELDSLQQSFFSPKKNNQFIILSGYNEVVDLYEKKQNLTEQLQSLEAITIIKDFTHVSKAIRKNLPRTVISYGLIFFLISVIIIFFNILYQR